MTPQEAKPLQEFLEQLTQVHGLEKDPEAEALIKEAIAKQPDAGYLLVQRSMLLNQALETAQASIARLQSQLNSRGDEAPASSRFLDPASAWGRSASASGAMGAVPVTQNPQSAAQAPQPIQPTAQAPQAPARPGFLGGGGGGSFLGNMAATAAGVAGGAFLFQGIENMMGHHNGGSSLFGQNGAAGSNAGTTENTTVNNFYESDSKTDSNSASADTASAGTYEDNGIDDLGMNDDLGSADDMSSI